MKPIDQSIFKDPAIEALGNCVMYLPGANEWRWMCVGPGITGVQQFTRPFTPVEEWEIPKHPFMIWRWGQDVHDAIEKGAADYKKLHYNLYGYEPGKDDNYDDDEAAQ